MVTGAKIYLEFQSRNNLIFIPSNATSGLVYDFSGVPGDYFTFNIVHASEKYFDTL